MLGVGLKLKASFRMQRSCQCELAAMSFSLCVFWLSAVETRNNRLLAYSTIAFQLIRYHYYKI